jgi:hypothetical protein
MRRFGLTLGALAWLVTGTASASEPGPAGTPVPEIRVELSTPAFFYTHNLGASGSTLAGEMRFWIRLMNGVNAAPPIILRSRLPDGVSFVNFANSGWNCSATGQHLTCTRLEGLTAASPQTNVRIRVNVAGDIPVPGSSTVRVLREHATLPPPDPTNCQSIVSGANVISDTGCVEDVVEHRQSRIWFEPTGWSHSPAVFLAGSTDNPINTLVRSEGFHTPHQPITARFLLPPGLLFNRGGPTANWQCTADTPGPTGQWVNCLYVLNAFNITAGPFLRVDVAPNVPVPGPVVIVAHVGNSFQPQPASIAECLEPDPPTGCGSYSIPTGTPPQAQMVFTQITPNPTAFRPGFPNRVFLGFTNNGPAAAGALTLTVALPPGLGFAGTGTSSPSMTCSASGTPAVGQVVTCTGPAGFGVSQSGNVTLNVEVESGSALQVPLTAAIGDTTRPGPTLSSCEANPSQLGCGQRLLRLSDFLLCDGYENPIVGCPPEN